MNGASMKTSVKVGISALVATAVAAVAVIWRDTEDSLRAKIVRAAVSQLDNTDPTPYWDDVLSPEEKRPKDWCGAFALWCLHQAGLALGIKWKIGYPYGFLLVPPNALPTVRVPKPGDIAYFDRSQHHAVVEQVHSDGTVSLINGNGYNPQMANGAISEVARSRVPLTEARAYFSIKPYIDRKLAA